MMTLDRPIPGVDHSQLLCSMAKETVERQRDIAETGKTTTDTSRLTELRGQLIKEIGEAGFVDACAVIGMFNGITKVADMTGVRLDPNFFEPKTWATAYSAQVSSVALAIEALGLGKLRNGEGVRLTSASAEKTRARL